MQVRVKENEKENKQKPVLWEQGVVGSNPTTPTTQKAFHLSEGLFSCMKSTNLFVPF